MSTELYYTVSNPNQSSPDPMAYVSDRGAFLHGLRNRAPASHQAGFASGGMNVYQQQQIQAALYQQQQLEFAQQQAQLEMHLQLEQMRLQNLALQEQIMMGQVHAQQQAHAQAQAEHLRGAFHPSQKPTGAGRLNFSHSQGGMFAERALARRQQAEADALYAQYCPNEQEEDDLLQDLPSHGRHSDRAQSQTPPALVFSKPDEAFPVLAPSSSPEPTVKPKLTTSSHQHTDSGSSVSTSASLSSFTTRSHEPSDSEHTDPAVKGTANKSVKAPTPAKKKFSDVVKSTPPPALVTKSAAPVISVNTAVPPKLNPFSSVFVPNSGSGTPSDKLVSASSAATSQAPTLSATSSTSSSSADSVVTTAPLYKAVRSKSPPTSQRGTGARSVSATQSTLPAVLMGAMPARQPRGPAAEAELTNQNFATRIRKRAIGAIKTLGTRPASSPIPTPTSFQFHPNLQQQMLEGLIAQQQQAALAAGMMASHPFLDVDQVNYSHNMVSPGLAHLMAAARAREERFGY